MYKVNKYEYWWNISKLLQKYHAKKTDVVIWNHNEKLCSIIKFSCSRYQYSRKIDEKMNTYGQLLRNLRILYPEYKFEMIHIVFGPFSYVLKSQLGFNNMEIRKII